MVVCAPDHGLQADVIFVIEGTAVNGAYINDLKLNYIMPSIEYFSQGNLDEVNYMSENASCIYGIVVYHAADCLSSPSSESIGPFSSPGKLIKTMDRLELIAGKGESHANIAEGLATALHCFEDLQQRHDPTANVQKHCILVCNSPPYMLPVLESHTFSGKTTDQLALILQERQIHLSIISPRKIPALYKLFEKAGGDLGTSQTKNYAKDPRHLVLLKGYSLKERPISPPPGSVNTNQNPLASPSPLANNDSPISGPSVQSNQPMIGPNSNPVQNVVGANPAYNRSANPAGLNQMPQHNPAMVNPGMVNAGLPNVRGVMIGQNQFAAQTLQAPPGYHPGSGIGNRGTARWMTMGRQYVNPQTPAQPPTPQSSALIDQLTRPPSSMPSPVNQFGPMPNNPQMANQIRMGILSSQQNQPSLSLVQQNVQSSMAQNPGTPGMQQTSNPNQVQQPNQPVITSQASQSGQPMNPQRQTIWSGSLEWMEKKTPAETQKIARHVPCSVSANVKEGEPEMKGDGWPSKLIMQLMPKQLIGNIGGAFLKNSKSVLFHPTNCEALETLTKVMNSGFAGCVHFTPNSADCEIKVLILLYTSEKRAYLGFIPNDQVAFVDRLRKVIQQQKSSQNLRQGTGGNINPQTGAPMTSQQNPATSQSPSQGLMMSQTNAVAVGGGQLTRNVVASTGQPGQSNQGLLGQNVPGVLMGQRLRMPVGLQQTAGRVQGNPQQRQQQRQRQQQQQQQQQSQGAGASGSAGSMMGNQRPTQPFANQLEAERQANLDKINQLRQTLGAAQQQEQQYKTELERISHMKTAQLQEALQIAQHQEMQYKILDQRLGNQSNLQPQNAPQRMLRPVLPNNPGLRTLLQQQPQYRQQMMMHTLGGSGPRPQMGQQMQNAAGNQQVFDEVPNFSDFM